MNNCKNFQIEHDYVFEETAKGLRYVCVVCNSKKKFRSLKK